MLSEIAFYELDENKKWQVSFIVKYITFVLRKHEKCLKLIERIWSALLKNDHTEWNEWLCFSQGIAITYIFVKVHKILDSTILPYFYGRVRLATGYNENLFKHLLVVLSFFPN